MRSNTRKIGLGILALAVAVALFVVLQDEGTDSGPVREGEPAKTNEQPDRSQPRQDARKPKPSIPTIVIEGGKPVGGIEELTYEAGDRIRFRVRSDVADEIHVHGYDLSEDVAAGGSVSFDFPASIEGIFEAELEHRGEHILELRVNP
jgi:hypothetical protein